jgi:hypothetical protein
VAYHGTVKKGGNVPLGSFLGRLHSGRPYLSLHYFSYKNRGKESKKRGRGEHKRKEGLETERKKGKLREKRNRRTKKKKQRKTEEEEGEKEGPPLTTFNPATPLPPPQSPEAL